MRRKLLVLNGPNLNLLGDRETSIYGHATLAQIEAEAQHRADAVGFDVDFRQTNSEGQLVDWIHEARGTAAAIIINAAAYSHTSVAIHDALSAFEPPIVEVHLSNVFRREDFRHHSYVTRVADGMICGLGKIGYLLAVDAAAHLVAARGA